VKVAKSNVPICLLQNWEHYSPPLSKYGFTAAWIIAFFSAVGIGIF